MLVCRVKKFNGDASYAGGRVFDFDRQRAFQSVNNISLSRHGANSHVHHPVRLVNQRSSRSANENNLQISSTESRDVCTGASTISSVQAAKGWPLRRRTAFFFRIVFGPFRDEISESESAGQLREEATRPAFQRGEFSGKTCHARTDALFVVVSSSYLSLHVDSLLVD